MEWTRSDTIALAKHSCTYCHGSGLQLGRKGVLSPCNCVLRSIFHICYRRFVKCVTQERHLSRTSQEPHSGQKRPMTWGRKDEEYIADFTLVTRRTLTELEYRLFRYHFLLGADWKLCSRKLGIDRGNFFHALYRIEQKLGLVFRELEPYALFPLEDYFQGGSRFEPDLARASERAVCKVPEHLRFPPIGRAA
jgi:hypothetical protein